jgi:hypothetical protein
MLDIYSLYLIEGERVSGWRVEGGVRCLVWGVELGGDEGEGGGGRKSGVGVRGKG